MKSAVVFSFFLLFLSSVPKAETVKVIKKGELLEMLSQKSEKIQIINFWATWCKPCVDELPEFEKVNRKENVQVKLISLDFVEDLEKRVLPFIKRKDLKSKIFLLNETDYNSFINQVSPKWSGAIPATIIIVPNKPKPLFYEKEFEKGALEALIKGL